MGRESTSWLEGLEGHHVVSIGAALLIALVPSWRGILTRGEEWTERGSVFGTRLFGANVVLDLLRCILAMSVLFSLNGIINRALLSYVESVERRVNAKRFPPDGIEEQPKVDYSEIALAKIILVFFPQAKLHPLTFRQAVRASKAAEEASADNAGRKEAVEVRRRSFLSALRRSISKKFDHGKKLIAFHRNLSVNNTPTVVGLVAFFTRFALCVAAILLTIDLPEKLGTLLRELFIGILVVRVMTPVTTGTEVIVEEVVEILVPGENLAASLRVVGHGIQCFFAVMMVGCVFAAFGFDMSGAFTGLGLGGVAAAFAAQRMLNELFATLSLLSQRPFKIGDHVVVNGMEAIASSIGFRATKLRAIYSGESVMVPNTLLVGSTIHNRTEMKVRRVKSQLRVGYKTRVSQLEIVQGIIAKVVSETPKASYVYSHLMELGMQGILFEYVFTIEGNENKDYKDAQHRINLELLREFESCGIKLFSLPHFCTTTADAPDPWQNK